MIIYFDTNVLLTLYLHPRTIVESLLKELETNFGDGIVIPFRAVFEFGKNRQEYIHTNFRTNLLAMAENKIHDANNKILSALKSLNAIKELDSFNTDYQELISEYSAKTDMAFMAILRQIGSAKSEFKSSFSDNDDPVRDFVNRHASKVSYSNNRLIELTTICDTRARCGIGPGKTDTGKKPSANDPFVRAGDFIIWYEILNNVPRKEEVVFVTEEKKADFFGLDGGIDPYLQSEFDETNPTATIEFLSLHDFLKTYIYESCNDQLLVSYFEGKRKKYEEIFNEKSFVDDCLDDYYDLPYDFLDDHISDGLDGYSIDSFDEIVVDDVERVTPFADVDLEYHSDTKTITTTFEIVVTGKLWITADCGHFDRELLTASFSANFKGTYRISVDWEYDGDSVLDHEGVSIDEIYFSYSDVVNHEFDDDYLDYSGETCVDCGAIITEENYGDGTRCHSCLNKHDD